jgi:hypothetical protein
MSRVGQNRIYIKYDSIRYSVVFLQINVYTPYTLHIRFWPTVGMSRDVHYLCVLHCYELKYNVSNLPCTSRGFHEPSEIDLSSALATPSQTVGARTPGAFLSHEIVRLCPREGITYH